MERIPSRPSRILLGEITSVHGIKGDVVIRSYAATPDALAAYGDLTDESGERAFKITVLRSKPNGVVAHIAGVDDRTTAEGLRGTGLFVDRARLPQADADSYYHVDLIGLAAVAPQGDTLGKVTAVHNYGAGDFLEIDCGDSVSELVPFTDAFVPRVDIAAGTVTVVFPADDGAVGPADENGG